MLLILMVDITIEMVIADKSSVKMIMPYLNFNGNCEEAFQFYNRAFNGKNLLLVRYCDAPRDAYPNITHNERNLIMHGQISLTDTGGISGSDSLWPIEKGSAINIHVFFTCEKKARKVFNALSEDGEIISALEQNPPPHDNSISGIVKDRFGFSWVLSA